MTKKRFISIFAAFALTLGLIPAIAHAADPIHTDLVIHKMQVESGANLAPHNGEEISDFTGTALEDARPMQGILFKYWTVSPDASPAQNAEIRGLSSIEDIEAYATANPAILSNGTETAATDANGEVTVTNLAEGTYLFGEVNGKSNNISEYIGVPFLLELPAMKTDGSGYFSTGVNALHVYPKNVKYLPGLDVETVNEAQARIGVAEFSVQCYNQSSGQYETVSSIGTEGTITLGSGFIVLSNLPAGKYRLVNTKAPSAYQKDDRPVGFTVSGGTISFDSPNSPAATWTPSSSRTPAGENAANPLITIQFKAKPTITKTDKNNGSERIGETVTWQVEVGIPAAIAEYQELSFTDTLDTRLDYSNNLQVLVGTDTLTAGTHYSASYNETTRILSVVFTPSELTAYEGQKIAVSYDTKINETAVMGEGIPNDVELDFDNGHGSVSTPGDPDNPPIKPPVTPSVWTGGAQFKKIDGSKPSLALDGAEFKIATDEQGSIFLKWTQELMDANTLSKFESPSVGGDIIMKSGTDGIFEIKGLKGGTYYLVETKAPNYKGVQYNLLRSPAQFDITKTSYNNDALITVENNSGLQIPQTGGIGTLIFTVVGLALMAGAIVMFRKKKKDAGVKE